MNTSETGPPEMEVAAPEGTADNHSHRQAADASNCTCRRRQCTDKLCECGIRHQDSVPAQLRRRREASYRCPPLQHSGRRDPWSRVVG
jgi:hypothetical protein